MIVITEAGNANFKAIQWDISCLRKPGPPQVVREEIFLVTKQILTGNSRVLRERFDSHQSSDNANQTLRTKEDSISSMEVWLRVLHNTVTPNTYKVAIDEMWYLTAAAENYEFDITRLKTWFDEWYIHQDLSRLSCQQLLFPCLTFDHSQGFLTASREAVYGVPGHIEEDNPTRFSLPRFRLTPIVTQNLNAARGRIRPILHAALWRPAKQLLDAHCSCKEKTLFGYIKALHGTGAWPFDPVWPKECVDDILSKLNRFSYQPAAHACTSCRQNYEAIVKKAAQEAQYYFDGLCLDCMKRSKSGPESDEEDYLNDNMPTPDDWSQPCEVRHGEPTWYYSFMGRREHRDAILKHLRGRHPKMRVPRVNGKNSTL
ncbi:MAG: hypothetical protein Q9195_000971 [Heterodermia aff. obscurata]